MSLESFHPVTDGNIERATAKHQYRHGNPAKEKEQGLHESERSRTPQVNPQNQLTILTGAYSLWPDM